MPPQPAIDRRHGEKTLGKDSALDRRRTCFVHPLSPRVRQSETAPRLKQCCLGIRQSGFSPPAGRAQQTPWYGSFPYRAGKTISGEHSTHRVQAARSSHMSLSLITNIGSLIASNQVTQNQQYLNQSVAQLSSGKRIVNASDDPGGLAVAMQTAGTLAGLNQANANASNAQAFLQTADGALNNIGNVLNTMQQIATEAADGSFSGSQIADLNTQYQSLYAQIDQIATGAQFNGVALLSGNSRT